MSRSGVAGVNVGVPVLARERDVHRRPEPVVNVNEEFVTLGGVGRS